MHSVEGCSNPRRPIPSRFHQPGNEVGRPSPVHSNDDGSGFAHRHLTQCPIVILDTLSLLGLEHDIDAIMEAEVEVVTYDLLCRVLNIISHTIWNRLQEHSASLSTLLLDHFLGAIEFVDCNTSLHSVHHPSAPKPNEPDLIGICPVTTSRRLGPLSGTANSGTVPTVVDHSDETCVEIKQFSNPHATLRALEYAFQHLKLRPDHRGCYCLSVTPHGFYILYADASGPCLSGCFSWDALDILAAYVYSLYDPPQDHTLRDHSIFYESSAGTPSWTLFADQVWYKNGKVISVGNPWRQRTTTFMHTWESHNLCLLIKDYYFSEAYGYDRNELLIALHRDGIVPGVVRVTSAEDVLDDNGQPMKSGAGVKRCTRRRLVLADWGEDLLKAKSVNDLLKTIYDLLEVHRTVAFARRVLHRDVSPQSVVMYPVWGKFNDVKFMDNRPPLIDDVLGGEMRAVDRYQARCLILGFDNATKLDDDMKTDELAGQIGTPMYIARAAGHADFLDTFSSSRFEVTMPELTPDARRLYEKVHGQARYSRYQDRDGSIHGGTPPADESAFESNCNRRTFFHDLEHDAESVYWSLLSAALQVQPAGQSEDPASAKVLKEAWTRFREHAIRDPGVNAMDIRDALFLHRLEARFEKMFHPCMREVAKLLHELGLHVLPSYATMDVPPPHKDHLHEAMQRLILNYLVEHRDRDIKLTPGSYRVADPDIHYHVGDKRPRPEDLDVSPDEREPKRRAGLRSSDSLPVEATMGFKAGFLTQS